MNERESFFFESGGKNLNIIQNQIKLGTFSAGCDKTILDQLQFCKCSPRAATSLQADNY